MLIVVNVFSILSAVLFFARQISALAFLISALLWFAMMIAFWFVLPLLIYRRSATFKDSFRATVDANGFEIENERGHRRWGWEAFSAFLESPHFFHLYFDSRSFFIIPKEAFEGDVVHEARALMRKRIG